MRDKYRFLAQAGDVLLASLDYHETLKAVADLTVRFLAEWCVIELVDDNGHWLQAVATRADPAKQALVERLGRVSAVTLDSRSFSIDVLRNARPSL